MKYLEFAKKLPSPLYGQIIVNNRAKVGKFLPEWDNNNNTMFYMYYTHKGNKGSGGFTLGKAWRLFMGGQLSTNPDDGNPDNYL